MDERLRILKMVEDGTITAEQAAELMKAMGVEKARFRQSPKSAMIRRCSESS